MRIISSLFFCLILIGCNSEKLEKNPIVENINTNPGSLFSQVPASVSGLDFKNILTETYDVNVIKNTYLYNGGGVGIIDINNDQLPDVLLTSTQESNKLFLNKGNLKFEDITSSAGLIDVGALHTGVSVVDINQDGFQDIYICKAGSEVEDARRNLFYINNGNNTFTERAKAYGLDDISSSNSANFFDYDLDGDLDLYLLNYPTNFKWSNAGELDIINGKKVPNLKPITPYDSDRFYRNDGNGKFTDVTKQSGIEKFGYGLSVSVLDINKDNYPDLYIANDFVQSDILYVNNKNGTFTDKTQSYFRHISSNSMGVDIGDINNDNLDDIISLDMLPADNFRQKTLFSTMLFGKYTVRVESGYGEQYVRNQLQLNDGRNGFSEIGCLAGVFQTDWSWAPLIQDFDNDGYNDIYITNGVYKDATDHDYMNFGGQELLRKGGFTPENVPDIKAYMKSFPSQKIKNYLFRNNKDLTFENMEGDWINHAPSFSNGAAYSDLDMDGDMDLVVNNIDDHAFIYENNNNNGNNYLQLKLVGVGSNLSAIGSEVTLEYDGMSQTKSLNPIRGFLSSVESLLHFGLGKNSTVDKVTIKWPDGKVSYLEDVKVNQRLDLKYESPSAKSPSKTDAFSPLFKKTNLVSFNHQENAFVDFHSYRLLPKELSRLGPKITTGDVNNDGREDIFVGNGITGISRLFVQTANGQFQKDNSDSWNASANFEDIDAVFMDFDSDGDQDIIVATGGYEAKKPESWRIRIHVNDGNGKFPMDKMKSLTIGVPIGVIEKNDFNKDGKVDLFVGCRVKPNQYPYSPKSMILLNSGDSFKDVTENAAPFLKNIGMITDVEFTDLNGDNYPEMIITGEWMGIKTYSFNGNKFVDVSNQLGFSKSNGWWNCIVADDYDNDGDIDFFVGNLGTNTRFKATEENPCLMYANDFDKNGSIDPIMAFYENGKIFPYTQKDELIAQLPHLKKKFVYHKDYAVASIDDIFSVEELNSTKILKAHTFETSLWENQNGIFVRKSLPPIAQMAPAYKIVIQDFDKDGHKDILIGGNEYGMEVETAHIDASNGTLLLGDSQGNWNYLPNWKHNLFINKEVRDLMLVKRGNRNDVLVVANNSNELQTFELLK